MILKLSPKGRTALWVGGGAFVGLAVGGLATSPDRALEMSPLWLIALAVYVGVVIGLTRDKSAAARAPKAAVAPRAVAGAAPAARPEALAVRFDFPDVPAGYPPVLGRGEPLQVSIRVARGSAAAEGAGVQLTAAMGEDTLTGDGITGSTGEVEFTLEPEGVGELNLTAKATSGALTGQGTAVVSIVSYDAEIERLFAEFRAYAVGLLGPEAHADTARELCDKLRARADPGTAKALLELARVYELVAYGERTADRRLYLAVLEQLMVLEHAQMPDSGAISREA